MRMTSVSLPPPSTPWIPLPVWNPSHGEWYYHTQHFISFYKPYFSTETDLCMYIHAGFFVDTPLHDSPRPPLHWIHINLRPFYLTFLPDFLTASPESFLFHHKSPNLAEWVLKTTKFHNAIWWIEIHWLLVILLPWLKLIVGIFVRRVRSNTNASSCFREFASASLVLISSASVLFYFPDPGPIIKKLSVSRSALLM